MKNLAEKSLLVNLIISNWSARKYDEKATAEVNRNYGSSDAGRFNKVLIAKNHLEQINKIANQARQFHYENTLPWSDSGERLLPADNFFEYTGELSKMKNAYESAVSAFISEYPAMISEAQANLNGLFKSEDYPDASDLFYKFRLKTTFMPVPDIADLRVNLSAKEVETLRIEMQNEMNDRFASAQRNIYERMKTQLDHMYKKLKDKDAVFRDSLFDNVLELVELLPRLNICDDPQISALCDELKSIYCDPETVRNNKQARKAKAQEVENMLSKMDAFFNPQPMTV